MRIFVESNFVLELAFKQEDDSYCQSILQAAEREEHQLYLPAYCLTEVFQTLGTKRIERDEMQRYLEREVKQHLREERVVPTDMSNLLRLATNLLLARTADQTTSLYSLTEKLARIAQIIPLTAAVLQAAPFAQEQYDLTPQDALVFASVKAGLQAEATFEDSLFISRNKGDFGKSNLLEDLRQLRCDYLSSFSAAVGRLRL